MYGRPLAVCCAISIAALLSAQTPDSLRSFFPADARIIEIADLAAVAGKPRALVLWMRHPKRIVGTPETEYCGTSVHGNCWVGPARVSLVDPGAKLINTIKIRPDDIDGHPDDAFWMPFFVPGEYYKIPHPDRRGRGKPLLLNLRDLTGEGVAAQFTLFVYEACGIAATSVFGYQRRSDRVVQYAVEVLQDNEKPELRRWMLQVFAQKPVRPGHWDFTWRPGHGSDDVIHENVRFDTSRQLFVDRQSITQ